jgi:hypothetical protein
MKPAPDTSAAIVLGIAATALPFAPSREAEAERWLRILRLHGEAGSTLQSLGVSEGPMEEAGEHVQPHIEARSPRPPGAQGGDVVALVTDTAAGVAELRGAPSLDTRDVLVAVMDFYGEEFDHVLRAHGTDRQEVLESLQAPRQAA